MRETIEKNLAVITSLFHFVPKNSIFNWSFEFEIELFEIRIDLELRVFMEKNILDNTKKLFFFFFRICYDDDIKVIVL